jgi:GNAT superfamily N-acetyltransferase
MAAKKATSTRVVIGKPRADWEMPGETLTPLRVMRGNRLIGGAVLFEETLPTIGPVVRIESVAIYREYRGRGLGTKLYETASRAACRRFNLPLASAGDRTHRSEGFWKKQLAKGRATKIVIQKPTKKYPKGRRQVVYLLSCPPPTSLKGVRRGR